MDYWSPDFILYAGGGLGGIYVSADKTVEAEKHTFDASELNFAAQLFLGLGIGFNKNLSLTGGYRHIFTPSLHADVVNNSIEDDEVLQNVL